MRSLLPALLPAVLLLPLVAHGDDASLARCGAAKVEAMARGCSDVLAAQARLDANGNTAGYERRLEKIRARVASAWAEAEADANDTRCAAYASNPGGAVDFLATMTSRVMSEVPRASCRPKLARLLRRHCRQGVQTEATALVAPADAAAARARAVQTLRDRLSRKWPRRGCTGVPTADEAADLALGLAGTAAGHATTRGMREIAGPGGPFVGAAIEPHEVTADPAYLPALQREVGSLTAENVMKWGSVHPGPTTWNFGPADEVVVLADETGMRIRGHTLIWGSLQIPPYVRNATTATELRGYMADHIAGLVGRYAERIAQWDVVNEPLSSILDPATPDGLDDNVFRQLIGPGYIAEAFHLARAADPTAKLYLNENSILLPGPRQDRFYQLVVDLIAAGAPIDGVGFQAHVGLAPPAQYPSQGTIEASLRRFTDLGLEVELTEIDVTVLFRPADTATSFALQGQDYRALAGGCLAVAGCTGLTTWGMSDQYTWIRSFFGFHDFPLHFDDFWNRKPAYFGMRGAFLARLLADA